MSAPDLRGDIYFRIDRAMLCFTRTRDRTLTWQAHFQEGVILLSRDDVLTERVLEGNNPTVSRYKAVFQTVSGAVIAEGKGTDRAYVNGIDETGSQEAVTNMWEKVRLEVDRIRLLRGLALRLE